MISTFVFATSSFATENLPDGFRGLKFGSDAPVEWKDKEIIKEQGADEFYVKFGMNVLANKRVFGANVDRIDFNFTKNQFCSVKIYASFHSKQEAYNYIASFTNKFGPPLKNATTSDLKIINVIWVQDKNKITINGGFDNYNYRVFATIGKMIGKNSEAEEGMVGASKNPENKSDNDGL